MKRFVQLGNEVHTDSGSHLWATLLRGSPECLTLKRAPGTGSEHGQVRSGGGATLLLMCGPAMWRILAVDCTCGLHCSAAVPNT